NCFLHVILNFIRKEIIIMPLSHEDLVKHLNEFLLKEQVSTNATILEQHSQDESYHTHKLPEVVLFPYSTKEVSNILKFANDHLISVATFCFGTCLEGNIITSNILFIYE